MALSNVIKAQERGGFYITKWFLDNKNGLNWPKICLKSSPKYYVPLCQEVEQVIHWEPTTLISKMILSKAIGAQDDFSTSQSGSPPTKTA